MLALPRLWLVALSNMPDMRGASASLARQALRDRIERLRRLSGLSAGLGAALIATGWIMFWPGAGFDQGFPDLIMVPDGLAAAPLPFAAPQMLHFAHAQEQLVRVVLGFGFLALLTTSVARRMKHLGVALSQWRPGRPPGHWTAAIVLVLCGHWVMAFLAFHLWKGAVSLLAPASDAVDQSNLDFDTVVGEAMTRSRIVLGFLALTMLWGVAHLGRVHYYPPASSVPTNIDASQVVAPSASLGITFEGAGKLAPATGDTRDQQADKHAFVMAQNAWLMGDKAALLQGLVAMQGYWWPTSPLARRRFVFLVEASWPDLPHDIQIRLAVLDAQRNAAKIPDRLRLILSIAGVIPLVWGAFLMMVAQRRSGFLERVVPSAPSERAAAVLRRAARLEISPPS